MTLAAWFAVANIVLAIALVVQRGGAIYRTRATLTRIHHGLIVVAAIGLATGYGLILFHGQENTMVPFCQQYVLRPSLTVLMAGLLASPWLSSER